MDSVSKERRKISFVKDAAVPFLAHEITKLANTLNISSGRVRGEDLDEIDRVIKITDNPDNFGEYEYDSVAQKLNDLDLSAIAESWVIRELLEKAKQFKMIFEAISK